jgi:hypothetical protein
MQAVGLDDGVVKPNPLCPSVGTGLSAALSTKLVCTQM